MNRTFPAKDPAAYERGEPCYTDEQGIIYTRADFLKACNGDEWVARRLFDLCYWQSPWFQFALFDESISLPDLSHHSKSEAHWLLFHGGPTPWQREILLQAGWGEQDLRTWLFDGVVCSVPWGIAYRETGIRDRTPQEEASLLAELRASSRLTTEAARARAEQFVADTKGTLARLAQTTCYRIELLPNTLAGWNSLENANGRGLRALLLSQLAESEEELWSALDRLPPTCQFLVTEVENLRVTAQVKGNMRGGRIRDVWSREAESPLIATFSAVSLRLNQEPLHRRLLRRWEKASAVRQDRIGEEMNRLEMVPLLCLVDPDSFKDGVEQTTEAAKAVLQMLGWRSAYCFAIEFLSLFSDEIPAEEARGFLIDLREKSNVAASRAQEASSQVYRTVEEARGRAFALLSTEGAQFFMTDLQEQESSEEEQQP